MSLTTKKALDKLGLTTEQKDKLVRELLVTKLMSKQDLKDWCELFLNVDLADCTVSRFSTSNPLEMVWDIYKFCLDEYNQDPKSIYYIAGRSSQKTLSTAVLQVLLPLHFDRGVVHLGGTQEQAQRAYSYFRQFVSKPYIKDHLKGEPVQKKTIFVTNDQESEVEILSISKMAVQGSHQPVVSMDELASLSPDKMEAYKDVNGIPTYTNDGKPWIKFGISSRKGKYTVIESEYENRDKSGVEFKFWTVLENTKRCPDEISGTEDISYYTNAVDNISLKEDEYAQLQLTRPDQASKFEKVNAKVNCLPCPLHAQCFMPGTPVRMANGTLKNIEDIMVGDLVLTHTGKSKEVLKTFKSDYIGDMYGIDAYGQNKLIFSTPDHPWLTDKGWKAAKDLTIGQKNSYGADYLVKPAFNLEQDLKNKGQMFGRLKHEPIVKHYEGSVYNLEVKDDNSYVVWSMAVHNCGGDLKHQTSTCRSLRPVQGTISQFKQAPSLEWWLSQSMSMTPSSEGLVFPKFRREVFEKTPRQMYTIFTGEDPGREIYEDELIKVMIDAGVKRYAGMDHGYNHPQAIVVVYEDAVGRCYIMKTEEMTGLEPNEKVDMMVRHHKKYKFTHLYPDTEDPGVNKLLTKARVCVVITKFVKVIEDGITGIRGKLSPTVGQTKLFGLKGNVESIVDNMEKYHFDIDGAGKVTDKVVDQFDDSIAALRYVAQNRWMSKGKISYDAGVSQNATTKEEINKKVVEQNANWLSKEINNATLESNGPPVSTKKSKNGGSYWGF